LTECLFAATDINVYLFLHQFNGLAQEIIDLSHQEARNVYNVVDSLSATITSVSIAAGTTWPYLTVPHFEVHGVLSNTITDVLQISFAPLVKRENKLAWEAYANENQGWIDESLALDKGFLAIHLDDSEENGTSVTRPHISPRIFRFDENKTEGKRVIQVEEGVNVGRENYYAPVWQQAPAPHGKSIVNFDLLSPPVFARVFDAMLASQTSVLSEFTNLDFLDGAETFEDASPRSIVMSPIYSDFGTKDSDNVVGILNAVLAWEHMFDNILHDRDLRITVVLHDSCGDYVTYGIEGPDAIFLGKGDLTTPNTTA
jgi:hypothetical protein